MTYTTFITPPHRSTDISNAMVLTMADTIDQAYADIVDYRDNGGIPSVLWQAVIFDDTMQIVSRLMAGEGPDITRALSHAWGLPVSHLRVHVFVGASSPAGDNDEVIALESITAAELIDEEEIDPVDPVDNTEPEE